MQDLTLKAGALLAILLAAACVPLFFSRDKRALRVTTLPWIVIGLYTFAMGGMVAMSRMHDSKDVGALWNRYTIHSHFAVIAVIVLGFAWAARFASAEGTWRRLCVRAAPVALGLCAMHLVSGWIYGSQLMESWWSSRLRDATCQMFHKAVPENMIQGPWTKFGKAGFNWNFPDRLNKLGLLDPPMPESNSLGQFRQREKRLPEYTARFETMEALAAGTFRAGGIAFLKGQSRPADGVLLCYKDDAGEWRVFAVAQVLQSPVFLRDALDADTQYLHAPRPGRRQTFFGEWELVFNAADAPKGVHEIAAWTFDFTEQTVARMSGLYRLDPAKGTVEDVGDRGDSAKK
jgi:hypothetical protein